MKGKTEIEELTNSETRAPTDSQEWGGGAGGGVTEKAQVQLQVS
jgi:hypothetical protein